MKTAFRIYVRAQALYALFTLPALLMPLIYAVSEALALACGFAGLALFLPVLPLLRAASVRKKWIAVCLVLAAGLASTYAAVWIACDSQAGGGTALHAMRECWPFPAAAFTAAAVAILYEHRRINTAVCEPRREVIHSGYAAPL